MNALDRFFHITERGSSVATETRGAVATFLTMAYVLVANPAILSAAGLPFGPVAAATAAAAGICCILMGLIANFPLALASGMGLNAVIAFQVANEAGSWQAAMGLVVLDGLIVAALVLLGLREAVMNAIPRDLRRAIGVGIGLFIALIGAVNARLVVVPAGTIGVLAENPTAVLPPVGYGTLRNPETVIALVGLIITAVLLVRRVTGALLIGIILSTLIALAMGVAKLPTGSWLAAPSFETLFKADIGAALNLAVLPLVIPIIMVDFFDTLGTASAVAEEAGLEDAEGRIPNLRSVLLVDAASASIGGLMGASSVTAYIESAAGVAEGARTGLSTVIVGVLFLFAMFAAPVAGIVPGAATAPALIIVGFLMC
ncbi:MAG TPA: NCS2 family permease, partial [Gemmatimonadaceae bacterium]|nr:NCS2 family permease [Gemmatimonadaceae bacterium]